MHIVGLSLVSDFTQGAEGDLRNSDLICTFLLYAEWSPSFSNLSH